MHVPMWSRRKYEDGLTVDPFPDSISYSSSSAQPCGNVNCESLHSLLDLSCTNFSKRESGSGLEKYFSSQKNFEKFHSLVCSIMEVGANIQRKGRLLDFLCLPAELCDSTGNADRV